MHTPHPSRRGDGQAGGSLVETLLAMVLLSVCLTSVASLLAAATTSLERAVAVAEAIMVAASVADALQRLPANHPWLAPGGGAGGVGSGAMRATWEAAPPPDGVALLRLQVRVAPQRGRRWQPVQMTAARPAW